MGPSVLCGNASMAGLVHTEGQWIGWVYYDAYKQNYSQWILWTYAMLSIIGNMAVIVWRAAGFRQSRDKLLSLFFVSLAAADCLWGIHLLLFQIAIGQCEDTDSSFHVELCGLSGFVFAIGAPAARFNLIIIAFHLGLNFLCAGKRYWRQKVSVYVTSTLVILAWVVTVCNATLFILKYYKGYAYVPELGKNYTDWTGCSPISWGVESSTTAGASRIFKFTFGFVVVFMVSTTALYFAIVCQGYCLKQRYGSQVKVHGLSRWAVVLLVAVAVNILSTVPILARGILTFTGSLTSYPRDADTAFRLTIAGIVLQFQIVLNPILYSMAEIIHCCSAHWKRKRQLYWIETKGDNEWATSSSHPWGDTKDDESEDRLLITASDFHDFYKSTDSTTKS